MMIMMRVKVIGLLAAVIAEASSFGAIRALTPTMWKGDPNCWQMRRHKEKMACIANGGAKIVFIGDSIAHHWEDNFKSNWQKHFADGSCKALNLGTSGDRTEEVLWRLTKGGELDGYEAKVIFLMIGTNNAGHFPFDKEPPSDAILAIREILRVIVEKQPKAEVVLTAIFPRGPGPDDPCRLRNDVVNREIRKFADGARIHWMDLTGLFLKEDGTLPREVFPDLVHPNATGYEMWYSAIQPYIAHALSGGPVAKGSVFAHPRRGDMRADGPVTTFGVTHIDANAGIKGDWWTDRLLAKRSEISDAKGEFDLVFFGDSITHRWESTGKDSLAELRKAYSVLDIGYEGDRTQHLVWRGENGELDGYAAKCVMLTVGTNNGDDSPADTAAGIKKILGVIAKKQPTATTLLLPIFPRGSGASDVNRVRNERVNSMIKDYADGKKVVWVDFNDRWLDANGDTKWVMPDGLHPNAEGYRTVWMPAVLPYFEKICSQSRKGSRE